MSIYYKPLNLNMPILSDTAPLDILKTKYQTRLNDNLGVWFHPVLNYRNDNLGVWFHPTFLKFLESKHICLEFVETFYSKPDTVQTIHVDGTGGDFVKINYVIGGKDSVMNWYTVKSEISVETTITEEKIKHLSFEKNQVELIHSTITCPISIVQVGIPHNVTNALEDRLCISMVIAWQNGPENMITMAKATEIFADYIVK